MCGCGGALQLKAPLKKDGTPRTPRAPSAYTLFVKENFASIKKANPSSTPSEVMRTLSSMWKESKQGNK